MALAERAERAYGVGTTAAAARFGGRHVCSVADGAAAVVWAARSRAARVRQGRRGAQRAAGGHGGKISGAAVAASAVVISCGCDSSFRTC